MKKILSLLIILGISSTIFAGIPQNAYAQNDLFACSSNDDNLRELNPDGSTISTQTITLDGNAIDNCTGLATNPLTGQTWIIIKVGSQQSQVRTLAIIDTSTGAATSEGVLGERFAGIAFAPNGDLIGVTGEGGNNPETLFTLSTDGLASSTFLLTLGNGDSGEAIAIDNECVLHHGSGISDDDRFYEQIDLVTLNFLLSVQQSGELFENGEELTSMVFNPTTLGLLAGGLGNDFYDMTTSGEGTSLGVTDDTLKGLAFTHPFAGLPVDADCNGALDENQIGGELLPIDTTALMLAGMQGSAVWMLPVLAGVAGVGAYYIRTKMNKA